MAAGSDPRHKPGMEDPTETDSAGAALLRNAVALVLGVITAFLLFWVMHLLISVVGELKDSGGKPQIEFVRLRKDTTPQTKDREPPKRQKPEQQPPPPEMNMAKAIDPSAAVGEVTPMIDTAVELEQATSLTGGGMDRDPVPLVRVDPEYPPRAKQKGIGGYVDVRYTITKVGTVDEVEVVHSKPAYVFDRAAVEAVRRWRYNPMIIDGEAVERKNNFQRFEFNPGRGSR